MNSNTNSLSEINGNEILKNSLTKKLAGIKSSQQAIRDKIKVTNDRIKKHKEVEKNRKSTVVKENNTAPISEIIKLTSGKILGYSLTNNRRTSYFDSKKRLVAIVTATGTHNKNGKKVSYSDIGLYLLGLLDGHKVKLVKNQ